MTRRTTLSTPLARMWRGSRIVVLTLVIACGTHSAAFGESTPGQAQETCSGILVNKVVTGPLTVPSGATCSLNRVRVTGAVSVQPGGMLSVKNSTMNADVVILPQGFVEFTQSHLRRNLLGHNPVGIYLDSTTVRETLLANSATANAFVAIANHSNVARLQTVSVSVSVEDSILRSTSQVTNGALVDLRRSTLFRDLHINGTQGGVTLCDIHANKSVTVQDTVGDVRVGGTGPAPCSGDSTIYGSLTINGTSKSTTLENVFIGKSLTGQGNKQSPVVTNVRVGHKYGGDFDTTTPPGPDHSPAA